MDMSLSKFLGSTLSVLFRGAASLAQQAGASSAVSDGLQAVGTFGSLSCNCYAINQRDNGQNNAVIIDSIKGGIDAGCLLFLLVKVALPDDSSPKLALDMLATVMNLLPGTVEIGYQVYDSYQSRQQHKVR